MNFEDVNMRVYQIGKYCDFSREDGIVIKFDYYLISNIYCSLHYIV